MEWKKKGDRLMKRKLSSLVSPPLSNGYDVRLLSSGYLEVAGSNPAGG